MLPAITLSSVFSKCLPLNTSQSYAVLFSTRQRRKSLSPLSDTDAFHSRVSLSYSLVLLFKAVVFDNGLTFDDHTSSRFHLYSLRYASGQHVFPMTWLVLLTLLLLNSPRLCLWSMTFTKPAYTNFSVGEMDLRALYSTSHLLLPLLSLWCTIFTCYLSTVALAQIMPSFIHKTNSSWSSLERVLSLEFASSDRLTSFRYHFAR